MPRPSALATKVLDLSEELIENISSLKFSDPITHIYNPLEYAWDSWKQYVIRYGSKKRESF